MRRLRRLAVMFLTGLGLALTAQGCWIPAKAVVAQVLLARAWGQALAGVAQPRPWPWADTWPVARLEAPRWNASRYVLADVSGRSLAFGPGHQPTSSPLGAAGNTVIAGHRDTHFAFLEQLEVGDELVVTTPDGVAHRYVVRWARAVDAGDAEVLEPTPEKALTLVTCHPFRAVVPGGRGRYAVRAVSSANE